MKKHTAQPPMRFRDFTRCSGWVAMDSLRYRALPPSVCLWNAAGLYDALCLPMFLFLHLLDVRCLPCYLLTFSCRSLSVQFDNLTAGAPITIGAVLFPKLVVQAQRAPAAATAAAGNKAGKAKETGGEKPAKATKKKNSEKLGEEAQQKAGTITVEQLKPTDGSSVVGTDASATS